MLSHKPRPVMHLLVLARVLFIGSDHVLGCEAAQDSDPSMQKSRGLEGSGFRVQGCKRWALEVPTSRVRNKRE